MERKLYEELKLWKKRKRRKPLLLQGSRQVGKTYLVKQFGRNEYQYFIYLNFEYSKGLSRIFDENLDPYKIIDSIGILLKTRIDPENTLIFFDEIQAEPSAISSLKYFNELAPEYHIIAAGSLLGVELGNQNSFPVGKITFLELFPLSFEEHLMALGHHNLIDYLLDKIHKKEKLEEVFHDLLTEHLKSYLYVGGMPDAVHTYRESTDVKKISRIHRDILKSYENDFSKYSTAQQAIKNSAFWNSVPYQLTKENKKFKYSDIKKKTRSAQYEYAVNWLINAGLIIPAYYLTTIKKPLKGHEDDSKFKVYMLDNGLLASKLELHPAVILEPDVLFREYNGAFIENFVATQLRLSQYDRLRYWQSSGIAEVDFILNDDTSIYPLEVKSGSNRGTKSMNVYRTKYNPKMSFRMSPRNFDYQDGFTNVPLYAVNYIDRIIENL